LSFSFQFAFAQQKTFETEKIRMMAFAKKWEAAPDSILWINYKAKRADRVYSIKTVFALKSDEGKTVRHIKIQKIKNYKSGARFERIKVKRRGITIAQISKMNDHYLSIGYLQNSISKSQIMLDEKIIILRSSFNHRIKKEYYFKIVQ